jgi:hypothetical protein
LLSLIRGITTGCLSYALKGKPPTGLCLIIIGTEGFYHERVPHQTSFPTREAAKRELFA